MDEYIEREAVVAAMNAEGYTKNMRVHKRILEIPAVDAVKVIRCENCVCCQWKNSTCTYGWCTKHCENVMRNEYCSWGEDEPDG